MARKVSLVTYDENTGYTMDLGCLNAEQMITCGNCSVSGDLTVGGKSVPNEDRVNRLIDFALSNAPFDDTFRGRLSKILWSENYDCCIRLIYGRYKNGKRNFSAGYSFKTDGNFTISTCTLSLQDSSSDQQMTGVFSSGNTLEGSWRALHDCTSNLDGSFVVLAIRDT